VLLSDSSEGYQAAVLQGVREAAAAAGATVRPFAGGNLGTGRKDDEQRNRIFDLVRTDNLDALIILTGAISDFCSEEHVTQFCKRFTEVPICTVGDELPGFPCVRGDNRSGVRSTVEHLVRSHGRRRIAFIRGPLVNRDAAERYQAYVDGLAEQGIAFEPKRVVNAEYTFQSGAAAIGLLLDRNELSLQDLDAIIAADDSTALGALSELGRRNIYVPHQISVVGFDDVESARTSSPPLSTVKQQLTEQGAAAVRVLLHRVRGRPGGESRVILPTTFVARRSCGCRADDATDGRAIGGPSARASTIEAQLLLHRPLLRIELQRASKGAFGAVPNWDDQLIATFADQLETGSDSFLSAFRSMRTALRGAAVDQGTMVSVLNVLRDRMLSYLGRDADLRASIERITDQARAIASPARRSPTSG
jgi:DNA-binding LacI/PurR family transcriptional regulator